MNKNIFNTYKENQNIDLDEISLTDNDYNGVIYQSDNDTNINSKKISSKIKKPQNFNFKIFVIIISISSVFIFGTVFYLAYSFFSPNLFSNIFASGTNIPTKESLENEKINQDNYQSLLVDEIIELTGTIQEIDYNDKVVEIVDLNSNEPYYLYVTGNTSLKDKYGKSLSLKEFNIGDIVDFSFNEKDELDYLNQNSNVIEYKSVQNVTIDSSNNFIKFENKVLTYSPYLKVIRNSEEYNLDTINSLDFINIKVYNDIVYSIEIEKSHGNLIFQNREGLLNATVEIDTDIFKSLSDISQISLTEGYHKIVVKEDNINTFIKEVYVSPNEDTIIDLSEVQVKSGILLINSNVSDYVLYVNNQIKSTNEPLQLPYGAYKIKIEKSGYVPFESEVIINSSQKYLNVTLESLQYAGELTLTSNPESAEVYVDNIFVGYTPLTYKTSYGNHTVLLKKTGYEDFELQNVYISETETSFNIIMRKSENTETTSDTTYETQDTENESNDSE